MTQNFGEFFRDKIAKIRNGLESVTRENPKYAVAHSDKITDFVFDRFQPVTEEQMRKVVGKLSSASCMLDPIPTKILKKCSSSLSPVLTKITNISLNNGVFPTSLKVARVKPLIKKSNLDPEQLKNYRPVSNLPTLSKIIEKLVVTQIKDHMLVHGLDVKMQSAYKSGHSTETALLRLKNDMLMAIDGRKAVVLVLLDLSAAFDTIDHEIMCCRLERLLGLRGKPLAWFRSYLAARSQCVSVEEALSEVLCLLFGVPQGSVLGPILFIIYTIPLSRIAQRYGIQIHMYADDTQLYVSYDVTDMEQRQEVIERLENCISDIQSWMVTNKLQLNSGKTELLVLASSYFSKHSSDFQLQIDNDLISPSDSAKNLGVLLDQHLNMETHVAGICKASYFHIRNIRSLKPILTHDALISVVHAFITSRLDYCNSLLLGVSDKLVQRLQRIQNIAARIITGCRKYDHITPILKELHWLPVIQRIQFKTLMITYKALNGQAPVYLTELLHQKANTRTLRSSGELILAVPKYKLQTYGLNAFSVAAPTLWNKLPSHIRNSKSLNVFKKDVKTFLFKQAFNC